MKAHCKLKKNFFFTSDFLKTKVLCLVVKGDVNLSSFFMGGYEREEFRVTTMDLYRQVKVVASRN